MCHLSSKQWSICFEGLLIAQLEKNRNTMVFLVWNIIWKAGCQKGWELFKHLISLSQFSSSRRGKKLAGDVVHTSHSKAIFLHVSKFTCISVPGVACFKAFPSSCTSLASKHLEAEDFFWTVDMSCKLLIFPVILIFPAALYLLQCLAYCSEQWQK